MAYASFAELAAAEPEGSAWSRTAVTVPGATWASIAIHGGGIERGSGEMARQVAGGFMSFYEFAGLKPSGNGDLHITSTLWDEPQCVALVGASRRTLSFHGYAGTADVAETAIGGLDTELVARVTAELVDADFRVITAPSEIAGTNPANICNRNATSAGVQLEMSNALRRSFFPGGVLSAAMSASGQRTDAFYRYAAAVQRAYIGYGTVSIGSVNNSRWTLLPISTADVTVSATVSTDKLATGGGQFLSLVARYADPNNCYLARLEMSTSQTVILTIRKRVGGTETFLVQHTLSGVAHAVGGRVAFELDVSGSRLRARAWQPGQPIPGWQLTTTDTDLTAPGLVGTRSILSTANTNGTVVARWGDVRVRAGYQTVHLAPGNRRTTVPTGAPVDVWLPAVAAL
ncbi:poly-gamma-glutamate hydrolase family protein [Micromonospora sp. DT229]